MSLCAFSLVSHSWRAHSQPMLWRYIRSNREQEAQKILNSPSFGFHHVTSLKLGGIGNVLSGVRGVSAASVERIIGGIQGLKHLELFGFQERVGLNIDVLNSPNLSG